MKLLLSFLSVLTFSILLGQNLQPYPIKEDNQLAWFEPANTPYQVGAFEKLELGISLPEDIQYRIDNFIFKGDSPKSIRSEEHTSELQSHHDLVCRLLLEKKK